MIVLVAIAGMAWTAAAANGEPVNCVTQRIVS